MTNLYAASFPPEPVPLTKDEENQLFTWLCQDFDDWTPKDHARGAMLVPPHELREMYEELKEIMTEDGSYLNHEEDEG